jgi:putative flippase GtrA
MNLAQLARFGTVGIMQNSLNVAVFAALHGAGASYGVSAVLAAVAAWIASFVAHRGWTFAGSASGRIGGHVLRYTVVFVGSVLVGLAILTLQVEVLSVPAVLAQAIAIVIVAPASFLTQRRWVFA